MLKAEGPYQRQSMAERKMALYNDIISYFDKGKVHNLFLVICLSLSLSFIPRVHVHVHKG